MLPKTRRSTAAPARSALGARRPLPRPEGHRVNEADIADRQTAPGSLALGTDNGTAFTSRAFRARLAEHAIIHHRSGYRDPESQVFIESWFSKLQAQMRLARRV